MPEPTFRLLDRFDAVEEAASKPSAKTVAARLLGICAAAGLVLGLSAVPPVLITASAAKSGLSVWESLPTTLPTTPAPARSVMLDRYGKPFATFYSENRVALGWGDVSQAMKDAQVSIEDTRFFEREGTVDVRALGRAAVHGGGGSTITQQYVKNLLMNAAETQAEYDAAVEHSPSRKLREMKLAVGLEEHTDRQKILTGYLNIANYGDGTFGVEAAAQHYFSTTAKALTVAQAATLAGIVQNPSLNPVSAPHHVLDRRADVLDAMLRAGRITPAEHAAATKAPLGLRLSEPARGCGESAYPYYCAQVLSILRTDPAFGATEQARARVLRRGGLTVHTALDPKAMQAATAAATKALGADNQFGSGVAMVQPGTGQVMGVGQNRTWEQTQLLYAMQPVQQGSTFKPITLAAALENGWDIAQTLDAPTYITKGGKQFHNQSAVDAGTMNAADALAVSSNTFFVKLETEQTSVADVQAMAKRLGMRLPEDVTGTEPATTLGVYDVTPVTVANTYATFAAHGVACRPTWVTSVEGPYFPGGKTLDAQCRQELEPGVADTVANALTTVIDGPNKYRTGQKMTLGRPAMGKTGTTDGNAAVWFAGGTPQVATAVWVGDPRGGFAHPVESLRLYGDWMTAVAGSTAAGPIWKDAMSAVVSGPKTGFGTPSTVRHKTVLPDVRGMDVHAALGVLSGYGVRVQVAGVTGGTGPVDTVTAQTPAAGTSATRGSASVTLTLTPGSNTRVRAS